MCVHNLTRMTVKQVCILHDKRRKTKDGRYPVRIYVYISPKQRDYIPTEFSLTSAEFEVLHTSKQLKHISTKLSQLLTQVNIVVDDMLSYDQVEMRQRLGIGKRKQENLKPAQKKVTLNSTNVYDWFTRKIEDDRKKKKAGNVERYEHTLWFYKTYSKMNRLEFSYFSSEKLEEIEAWYVSAKKKSRTTTGIHARHLRRIFNMAIKAGVISRDIYPFGSEDGEYVIPKSTKTKKSLSRNELAAIFTYVPKNEHQEKVLDYFTFSYYGNGMNMKDLLMIKNRDIHNDIIVFYREKIKDTTKGDQKPIMVHINEEMWHIIRRYRKNATNPDAYVFPDLNPADDPFEIRKRCSLMARSFKHSLQRIATKFGIVGKVSFGVARHTCANALKQEGVDVNSISEMLGHQDPKTTEHYLKHLENEIVGKYADKLKLYHQKQS